MPRAKPIAALLVVLGLGWPLSAHAIGYPIIAVKASGNEAAFPPQNVTDGNPATRWSCLTTAAAPCWMRLDVGAVKSIDSVSIAWFGSARYAFSIAIAGADFNYKTVASGESAGNTGSAEVHSFAPTSGRFVKITISDNSVHDGRAAIAETAVGGGNAVAVSPTPTAAPATDAGQKDTFGIVKKYPTLPGSKSWTSAHWANNKPRTITGRDPDDPTGVSESRSDQAQLYVDGKGVLQFTGADANAEPRFHLNGVPAYFFKNVEITFYYLKGQDADVDWGGMVIGARSGPEGHSKPNEFCDAHTYYGRFRNDGKYDFEKELKHPASSTRNGTNIWSGATDLPANKWIGMKYMVYNVTVSGKPAIKLELYRDMTGGVNGGTWEKIGETIDAGGWSPPQSVPGCTGRAADYIPSDGGGVIVLRNTGSIKDSYKWMTLREITPPS